MYRTQKAQPIAIQNTAESADATISRVASPTLQHQRWYTGAMPVKRPRELKLYRIRNPDYFDKAVACSIGERCFVCTWNEGHREMVDFKLLKKMKKRPGAVFRKLAGLKKDWEVWE